MAQKHLQLLRNNTPYTSYTAAYDALKSMSGATYADGTPIIARYNGNNDEIKTLLGIVNKKSGDARVDIINDVQASILRAYNLEDATSGAIATNDSIEVALNKLENQVIAAKAAATTKVVEGTDTGNNMSIASAISADDGSVTYTINLTDVASKTALDAEIAARKAVDGQTGQTYAANADANYISGVDSLNAADVALDTAVASLSDKVDNLNYDLAKNDNKVVVSLNQTNGKISGTSENITSVKLDGYAEGTDADIAATDTLGQALGKLQAQINAMDKTASAVAGQVVTTVAEEDGKVTETKANVKDLELGGYSKTTASGAISSNDTVNVALSKIENNIDAAKQATTVASADKSINVTTAATGTDINVNIKSGEHVLAKTGGNGLYTDIKLSGVTPSSTTVKEEYSLVATDGTVLGTNIKIYKDSSISKIYLGYPTDTVDSTSGVITSGATGEAQSLNYVYHKEDGTYEMVHVDVSKFLVESEFASGVTADTNGVVHGVVDTNSEKVITSYDENGTSATTGSVLTVGTSGFSVANIQTAIDAKVGTLDYTDTAVAGKYVSEVDETDGKIAVSRANVSDAVLNGYAKGEKPASTAIAATDDVKGAIAKLEHQIDDAKAAATTKVVEGTDEGNNMSIASGTSSTDGSVTYTINLTDVASKAALNAEIAARKAVDGQDGQAYAANTGVNYIGDATSLNNADVKLDAALKAEETAREALSAKTFTAAAMTGGTVGTATTADGTVQLNINTDGSQVLLTGYQQGSESGAPVATDSVNAAISKLYNRTLATEVKAGSATTVSQAADGTTVDVKLDTESEIAEYNAAHAKAVNEKSKNVLEITENGLYLNNNWDCGTY